MRRVGRHSTSNAGLVTSAVIAGVVLVAGGGAWAMASALGDDGTGDATATSATSPATSPSVKTSAGASASPSATPSTPATSAPADAAVSAAADKARAACTTQVKAAEGVATAVASSALHWRQHTEAYTAKLDGRISLATTQKRYAASKAFGLADEKAVAATTKTFMATGAACSQAATSVPDDAVITACSTRLAALNVVRTTGTKVQDEWSAHMRMMADKTHTDAGAYHQTWVKAVDGAPKSLANHAAAVAAVAKAPACA